MVTHPVSIRPLAAACSHSLSQYVSTQVAGRGTSAAPRRHYAAESLVLLTETPLATPLVVQLRANLDKTRG